MKKGGEKLDISEIGAREMEFFRQKLMSQASFFGNVEAVIRLDNMGQTAPKKILKELPMKDVYAIHFRAKIGSQLFTSTKELIQSANFTPF